MLSASRKGIAEVRQPVRICGYVLLEILNTGLQRVLRIGRDDSQLRSEQRLRCLSQILLGRLDDTLPKKLLLVDSVELGMLILLSNHLCRCRLERTCALVPPIPKELTLIRAAFPSGQAMGLTGTVIFFSANGTVVY